MLKRSRLVAIMSILLLSFSATLSAHEMYYSGSAPNWAPIPLKWSITNFGAAHLKFNNDSLSSDYTNHYVNATNAWPNSTSKVQTTRTTFSYSNVDILTLTNDFWRKTVGASLEYYAYALTDVTTTDNILVTDTTSAQNSSRLIKYGHIYMNPHAQVFGSENDKLYTMVHEIGHVLGLGHPNSIFYPVDDDSVMRQSAYSGYTNPRNHDINDISSKY